MKIIVDRTQLRSMEDSLSASPRLPNRPLHEMHPNSGTHSNSVTANKVSCPGFIGAWHSGSDMAQRRMILKEIVRSIHRRRPNASSSMRKQLPMMAKKMEETLYKEAPSREDYVDLNTLDRRLEALAQKVKKQADAMNKATLQSK